MFAPAFFPVSFFAPRYFPPASDADDLQGGSGSVQAGGFRIGFHQGLIKHVSAFPEVSFEILPVEVKDTSRDFEAEVKRFELGISLIESKIKILELESDLMARKEIEHIKLMLKRLVIGKFALEIVRKRRVDEEELIVILSIDN